MGEANAGEESKLDTEGSRLMIPLPKHTQIGWCCNKKEMYVTVREEGEWAVRFPSLLTRMLDFGGGGNLGIHASSREGCGC